MTPKEKSKELIKTFQIPANHSHISDGESTYLARRSAIIHVDGITSLLAEINNKESFNVSEYANYYHEVLAELNK